jgi:GNAT superfamily N-acetyltransferase
VLLKRPTLDPKHIASGVMGHRADVEIRAPHDDDSAVDGVPLPRRGDDTWHHTRVAVVGGRCVGSAALTLSPETDTYFCEVNVAPDHRRQRIGTRLYAAVYETNHQRFPVLTRAMESRPLRRQFAEALGCTVLVHCPEPWVDPTSPAFRRWADKQPVPPTFALVVMRGLPTERVEQAWATYYEWAHRPFGVVHTDRLSATWTRLSSTIDQDASIIAIDSTTADIVAISLATPDVWDGRTMIISETVHETQQDGSQLVRSAVAASLNVLGQRGIRRVELEGHTTDAHSPDLVQSLPPGGGDPMDILKLAPPTQPVP